MLPLRTASCVFLSQPDAAKPDSADKNNAVGLITRFLFLLSNCFQSKSSIHLLVAVALLRKTVLYV